MKKLYPLLSVLFLIYWGCNEPRFMYDSNYDYGQTDNCETVTGDTINLWGVDYSVDCTTELDLSNSGLTGEIPPEIGNLTNLSYLNLEDNQLTGSIPPEIENLTKLDVGGFSLFSNKKYGLFLSNNQLSGEIPESICNFDFKYSVVGNFTSTTPYNFSISNNKFCPPYPSCIEDYVGEQDTSNCGQNNIEVVFQSDWNLVGLPLDVEDASYSILFPESIEGTLYSFNGGYNLATIVTNGEGYWLRFNEEGSTTITGIPINELTISLNEGWNLISGISISLNISDIQDPDGIIIAGTIYGFAPGGYSNEEIIEPGKGYWLRANNSGNIILISP